MAFFWKKKKQFLINTTLSGCAHGSRYVTEIGGGWYVFGTFSLLFKMFALPQPWVVPLFLDLFFKVKGVSYIVLIFFLFFYILFILFSLYSLNSLTIIPSNSCFTFQVSSFPHVLIQLNHWPSSVKAACLLITLSCRISYPFLTFCFHS